jgi:L-arabinose transport system substrate-binding protein
MVVKYFYLEECMKRSLGSICLLVLVSLCVLFFGCKKQDAAKGTKPLKIGYISKFMTAQWFVDEDRGLADACKELGIDYISIDANFSDEACDAAIDNLIAQEIDALAICITNQGNGPSVAMKLREAGIALITIDDNIVDENGKPVPHVGMPTLEVGELGGEMLAKYANERNFFAPGNNVKVMALYAPHVSVMVPRLQGYKNSLLKNTPLKETDFITVEVPEAMIEDSLPGAQSTVQGHPEVTHWIAGCVNDDSAIAILRALEEARFTMNNILVCGIGGQPIAADEFKKGGDNFMTVALNPYKEGHVAVELLYDHLKNGTPLPENTFVNGTVATQANWQELIK